MATGRNEPCPCGSGKKYKKCCLDGDVREEMQALKSINQEPLFFNDYQAPEGYLQKPSPNNIYNTPFPEITEEQEQLVEDWWDEYQGLESPDLIRQHIERFMENHPELVENLQLDESAIFELGAAWRREGRLEEYIIFLLRLREEFPSTYLRSGGFYDSDIIAWLISQGRESETQNYLDYFISYPVDFVDQLFESATLMMAKDIRGPLLYLVSKVKDTFNQSDASIDTDDIIIPLIYDKLGEYIKTDNAVNQVHDFVAHLNHLFGFDKEKETLLWSHRFKSITRPYQPWDYDPQWGRDKVEDLYFDLSDNFMYYLHDQFGLSWICAQYHSSLIFDYGRALLKSRKGKKHKELFDLSISKIDKLSLEIGQKILSIIDATTTLSLYNAIYYLAAYLEECKMIDRKRRIAVEENAALLYKESFPQLLRTYSEAACFEVFPFWGKIDRERRGD